MNKFKPPCAHTFPDIDKAQKILSTCIRELNGHEDKELSSLANDLDDVDSLLEK